MKLETSQTIAGYPILQIRDLFKWRSTMCRENVQEKLRISAAKATKLTKELVKLGYLEESSSNFLEKQGRWYKLLPAGRTLALARAVPPMKREKAENLLAEFLGRVQEVNANPDFLYKVDRVLVFGSYLRLEMAELNDLDVAVELTCKIESQDEYEKAREAQVAQAYKDGRSFSNFTEELYYPYLRAKAFLRNRSRYLSLHTTNDEVLTRTETHQVFPLPTSFPR